MEQVDRSGGSSLKALPGFKARLAKEVVLPATLWDDVLHALHNDHGHQGLESLD